MAVKNIEIDPSPILRQKSVETKDYSNPELIEDIIQDLKDTLYATNDGIGIAAPQIGENIRIFLIDINANISEIGLKTPLVFIDPIIQANTSLPCDIQDESCLSCPGITIPVERPMKINIEFTDENGNRKTKEYSGLMARAIQHENDHLDGITLLSRQEK